MQHLFIYKILFFTLLALKAKAAFKDFVVAPETELSQHENFNELDSGCQAKEEVQNLISFQDVLNDGTVDTELLVSALMQHAQRLGMSLEQLAQMHSYGQEEEISFETGCSAADSLSYEQQPSWSDVFFN